MFRFNVKVSSMMFGADESGIEPIHFYSHVETLTVRALIARTVEQQIQTLLGDKADSPESIENAQQALTKQYLSVQDIEAMSQQGSIRIPDSDETTTKAKPINPEEEIRYACKAFRQRRFFISVNGEQPLELDEMVTLTENSTVLFVRLMPLVGG